MGFLSRPGAGTGGNYHDAELPVYQYGEDGTKHNKNADFRRLDREGYSADFWLLHPERDLQVAEGAGDADLG